jgi:hypothetical protein
MQVRFKKLAILIFVALSLSLISCGGREGTTSSTSPLLAAGGDHTVALKKDGTLWAWGSNQDGQLGNGTNTDSHTPVQIGKLPEIPPRGKTASVISPPLDSI